MYISGPVNTHIINISATGLQVQNMNAQYFEIVGSCQTGSDGVVTVTIGTDTDHAAELKIKDGQLMWDPEVISVSSSKRFYYSGIDHIVTTFDYALKFSNS